MGLVWLATNHSPLSHTAICKLIPTVSGFTQNCLSVHLHRTNQRLKSARFQKDGRGIAVIRSREICISYRKYSNRKYQHETFREAAVITISNEVQNEGKFSDSNAQL